MCSIKKINVCADELEVKKRIVNWKTVTEKNIKGRDFESVLPRIIDRGYRGTLLSQILAMPKKNPITFADAVRLAGQKQIEAEIGHEKGQYFWYAAHFVDWISSLGYHIELSGDEFEPYVVSNKVA
jgi:hypothetical protein